MIGFPAVTALASFCISYLSAAEMKRHDQRDLQKKEVTLLYSSEGLRGQHSGETWQEAHQEQEAGH